MAFVVCSAIGLDTSTSSSDYIQLHAGEKKIYVYRDMKITFRDGKVTDIQ